MAARVDSDEYYVLDLCDEVLGVVGDRQAKFDWLRGDPSARFPAGAKLPVDGYWPTLGLVVEFHEEQHSAPSTLFDRRQTVSGVGRGEQRRIYDERRWQLIPAHGLELVVIEKSSSTVKGKKLVRHRERDLAVVEAHLAL